MSILSIIIVFVIVGVILYLINKFVPMDQGIKNLLNIVIILLLVIWLLQGIGVFGTLGNIKIK